VEVKALAAFVLLFLVCVPASADVKLPGIFGDNMVLQRGMRLPIWGWAAPGETVTVRLGDAEAKTTAGQDGRWQVKMGPLPALGPLEFTVKGTNTVTLRNVLVGDVWVCSGQSNMEWTVAASKDAPREIAAADYPDMRLFTVQKKISDQPLQDVAGAWTPCSPRTVPSFSAVGYFFGRTLRESLDVPVGLINTSWGGTPAESWTSREALKSNDAFLPILDRYEAAMRDSPKTMAEYKEKLKEWEKVAYFEDPGNKGFGLGWADLGHDVADWQEMLLPAFWEIRGLNIDGVVWFRKEVAIPQEWAGKALTLSLGPIDDTDSTYFNGVQIGSTGMDTPNWWAAPRRYTIAAGLVKPGRAVIAVRVYDRWMSGGFGGIPADMTLVPRDLDTANAMSLAGPWLYKIEAFREQPKSLPPQPLDPSGAANPSLPSGLYNAMVRPLMPFGIKGVIWYQGESNADRAYQYRALFPAMIRDWRGAWEQGDFPFLFVQLANYQSPQQQPSEDAAWPELREAQLMALSLPDTGMACAIDIGDAYDIHPKNKQEVGRRLALAALGLGYGRDVVRSGPTFDHMEIRGDEIVLTFTDVGGGLVAHGDGLQGFAVAGEDKKFVWAKTKIVGNEVIVWSDQVPQPVAVRYDWANNPVGNLYNAAGLPASPFRTDDWPGVTLNNR